MRNMPETAGAHEAAFQGEGVSADDLRHAIELFEGYRIVAGDRAVRVTELVQANELLRSENVELSTRVRRLDEALAARGITLSDQKSRLRSTKAALKRAQQGRQQAELQLRRLRRRRSVRLALKVSAMASRLNPRRRG